jgi:hypothetical protein
VKVEAKWHLTIKNVLSPLHCPRPPKKEDTTVETLDNMMARLKILEDVKKQNEAQVKELQEIREERRSEGVLEKPPVVPDDPFAHIEPMHKRTSRKAKHGHGTRTFSRSLGGDFEEEEYYAPRRKYKANTGRAGHVEQRPMKEDSYILGGEFSFPMKEDLERREVVGVSSTSPFMTTSVPTISQGGAPLQRSPVRERMGECVESDV